MPTVEINDLGNIGLVKDQPAHQLPPEAWTIAENVRFFNGGVERLGGQSQVFGTPSVAPHFTLPISTGAELFWIYTSLTKAYVWNGTSHTNITRQAGGPPADVDYTAPDGASWNGTLFGGLPILNNGADVPQVWLTPTVATKLTNLANWPGALRAKVIRAFGPFLVAVHITDGATIHPHRVRWSDTADPGAVPASWDVADPTTLAGQFDIPDVESGVIVDALAFSNRLYIYKENAIHYLTFVGGQSVMDRDTLSETTGLLAPRCVAMLPNGRGHFFATQDDLCVHNGSTIQSVLSKKMKRHLQQVMSPTTFGNSFVFANPAFEEMWFCYPSQGNTFPDRALIWNYSTGDVGQLSEADVGFRGAAAGTFEEDTGGGTWDSYSGTVWDTLDETWSVGYRRKVVLVDPARTRFLLLDDGLSKAGDEFTATVQRTGLAIIGRKRSGEWVEDYSKRKLLTRLYPKVEGGPIRVRVGAHKIPAKEITWLGNRDFNPKHDHSVDDVIVSGQGLALEFSTRESVHWRLDGYQMDLVQDGEY